MQQNLDIEFLDGTKRTVVAIAADFVAFESRFDLSITKLDKEVRLTHLLFLAWHADKRTKNTEADFDAWVETVATIGMAGAKK